MKRLVIVEGPDGSGKSTLAKKLAKDLGWDCVTTGGKTETLQDISERVSQLVFLRATGSSVIDRCTPISDYVYRNADGREQIMTVKAYNGILEYLNPVIVYCRLSPPEKGLEFMDRSYKAHKPPEYADKVAKAYSTVVSGYGERMASIPPSLPVLPYDWQVDSYEDLVKEVKACVGF